MFNLFRFKSQRYTFWKVFWVVIAVNAVLLILTLGIIVTSSIFGKAYNWEKLLSFKNIAKQGVSVIATTVFFYFSLNHFNELIVEKRKVVAFVRSVLLFALVPIAYHFATYFVFEKEIKEDMKDMLPFAVLAFTFAISGVFVTGISLLIAYLNSLRDDKKQRKVLEQQKMQLEVEKSQANLKFLKAQINPHFLHNTLNFLCSKALPLSDELSEGILTLSDIMRYALSDGNTVDGKSLLKEEIEHVQNVIKINQLRFSNNLQVRFQVEGVLNGARIIPFVLITLVENAFKHGDLKSAKNPIEVFIKVEENRLMFYCRNKKKTGPKELSTGLGLDNIRKRLDLAYGTNYNLMVRDDKDFYTTELIINSL